jgi:hypothetical protein
MVLEVQNGVDRQPFGAAFSGRREYGSSGVGRDTEGAVRHAVEGTTINRSTGIRHEGDEPVSQALGELAESVATAAGMTADLPLVEDQRQSVG